MATKPLALIIKAPGTNCDAEMENALRLAGAQPKLVYLKELEQNPAMIRECSLFVIPGGFSYGDYMGSGKALALFMESTLMSELKEHVKKGRHVLGVCNGFQALVKLGFLPGWEGNEVSLAMNQSGKFECRWVSLKWNGKEIELPVAHGEGRFVAASKEVLKRIKEENLVFMRYQDNHNGSDDAIAGISNAKGTVIGLMPHPERFVQLYQHPNAASGEKITPWGLEFLRSIVKKSS